LYEPCFGGKEWEYVKECLDTGWVSSAGKYVDAFEKRLAEYTGAKSAVATVNGTAALHICLHLAGVEKGDEVLIPTLTFVATANAVAYCQAIPHFVDCEENTLGVDAAKLEEYLGEIATIRAGECINKHTGGRIKAIVPMHTFGHPVDLDPLSAVCERFNLALVEDAAESLGSYYKGKHTGTLGRLGALSFNGNKVITTGGGGAILTNDEGLGRMAKHLTTTAKLPHPWAYRHDQVGYNYRMPNINAALGCAQLEQLSSFLSWKRALAERYARAFETCAGVKFMIEPPFGRSNYWLNVLLLNETNPVLRDAVLEATNRNRIGTRPAWALLHTLPMYRKCPMMNIATAESLADRLINIPSSAGLAHAISG
jgi:perosamine synthetase